MTPTVPCPLGRYPQQRADRNADIRRMRWSRAVRDRGEGQTRAPGTSCCHTSAASVLHNQSSPSRSSTMTGEVDSAMKAFRRSCLAAVPRPLRLMAAVPRPLRLMAASDVASCGGRGGGGGKCCWGDAGRRRQYFTYSHLPCNAFGVHPTRGV